MSREKLLRIKRNLLDRLPYAVDWKRLTTLSKRCAPQECPHTLDCSNGRGREQFLQSPAIEWPYPRADVHTMKNLIVINVINQQIK